MIINIGWNPKSTCSRSFWSGETHFFCCPPVLLYPLLGGFVHHNYKCKSFFTKWSPNVRWCTRLKLVERAFIPGIDEYSPIIWAKLMKADVRHLSTIEKCLIFALSPRVTSAIKHFFSRSKNIDWYRISMCGELAFIPRINEHFPTICWAMMISYYKLVWFFPDVIVHVINTSPWLQLVLPRWSENTRRYQEWKLFQRALIWHINEHLAITWWKTICIL